MRCCKCRGGTDMCFVLGFGRQRLDLKQYRISGLTIWLPLYCFQGYSWWSVEAIEVSMPLFVSSIQVLLHLVEFFVEKLKLAFSLLRVRQFLVLDLDHLLELDLG